MELWTAILLGVLGGLHCAGMCGPLMLALPVTGRSPGQFAVGRLIYHSGRLATYTALGLVFGLLGRTLLLIGVQRWVSVGLGVLMLGGVIASPRFLELPGIVRWVGQLKSWMGGFLRQRTFSALAVLGGLNGLLPCGLVYAACAGAAASGDGLSGARFMLAFGLGTLPVMLAISLSGRLLPTAVRLRLRHVMPVSVALLGGLLILRGLSLGIPYVSPDLEAGAEGSCHGPAALPASSAGGLP